MTAVLAYTSPAMGHLYPMMPLLLELRDRGLDVHVRTLDTLVDQARAAGLSAERIDARLRPIADKHPDWAATNAKAALERSATMFAERAVLDGPDFRRAIEEVDPDLLIVDTNAWGALVVAEAQRRPWLHFSPYLVPLRSTGTPPFGPGLPRWDNPVGRVRDAVVGRLVFGAVERSIIPRINALRTPAGLAPVRSFDDLVLAAPLVAICSATPFDYPHPDWPSHVISIGAMTWEDGELVVRQYFARHYGEEPAVLSAFLKQASGPRVLVSFNGKSYDWPYVRMRAAATGVPFHADFAHLDLLHASRRVWGKTLPDCRLQTLEHHVCGCPRRSDDIPGSQIPDAYHEFVRTGDAAKMLTVLEHNLLDLATLARLLVVVSEKWGG